MKKILVNLPRPTSMAIFHMSPRRMLRTRHLIRTILSMQRKPTCIINSSNGKKNFVLRKWHFLSRILNTRSLTEMLSTIWRASWEWTPPLIQSLPAVLKSLKCNLKHFTLKNGKLKRTPSTSQFKSPLVMKLLWMLIRFNQIFITRRTMKISKWKISLTKPKLKSMVMTGPLTNKSDLIRDTIRSMKNPNSSTLPFQSLPKWKELLSREIFVMPIILELLRIWPWNMVLLMMISSWRHSLQ